MRRQILKSLLVDAAVLIGTELRTQQPAPPVNLYEATILPNHMRSFIGRG